MNTPRQLGAMRFGCTILLAVMAWLVLPNVSRGDGLIVITDSQPIPHHFAFAPLEVTYHHVTVDIANQVAVTKIDQEFHNPNNQVLEGTYIFPLPAGAHIDHFSMDINGKPAEAEMLDAATARKYYEEIVRKYRDPALLEYAGRDAVKVHIFPIDAYGNKHIQLQYTQALKSDAGLIEYTYPLNTEKFSSKPLNNVSVVVKISGSDSIKSIYCPTHTTEIKRDGDHAASIGYEESNARPDTDFKIIYSTSTSEIGANLLTYRAGGEDGYFMLLASPGFNMDKKAQAKDVCFVLDTSGSMSENNKLEQAKKALNFCLANLNSDDRFQLIRFSTDVEPLFDGLVAADDEHLKKAKEFVADLKPTGGTSLNDAMMKSLALHAGATGDRPYDVVFLTDGMPTVGESNDEKIVANARANGGSARVFCFGIGTDVNTHLLDGIAGETRATSTYVTGKEDIEVKVSSFFSKIREPVLTNVAVAFEGNGIRTSQVYPSVLPDLFKGESLTIFGRYSGSGAGSVKITGTFNGEKKTFVTDVKFADSDTANVFIPRLWATRRVGWLLDEIRLHGESAELKNEVVALARKHGIVTPYTSFMIMEDEQRRNVPLSRQSFGEMKADRDALAQVGGAYDYARSESADKSKQSGQQAVTNSSAMHSLKDANSMAALNAPASPAYAATQPMARAAGAKALEFAAAAEPANGLGAGRAGGGGAGGAGGGFGYRNTTNYAQQVRVINGRSFYQNNETWTDSTIQAHDNLKQAEIKFGSDEYFKLLKDHPEVAEWLALGTQVDLVVDDTIISCK